MKIEPSRRLDIRNIAIIAHVDHGKTTLVDAILRQTQVHRNIAEMGERIMDTMDLERERGITIRAKNASVTHHGVKINIVDTPGHADFGGEVERVLNMVEGALLLVDAQEGPMPQTRFVLKKALELGHKIIVVINKIDKPNARINHTLEKIIELFMELGATNEQLDFPIIYAAGRLGKAGREPELEKMTDIKPIFDAVIKHIPEPKNDFNGPLQMMTVAISYDNYRGKIGVGKILQGKIKNNQMVSKITRAGEISKHKITSLMSFYGLSKIAVDELEAGDIAAISGVEDILIGDTISEAENPVALPPITIEKPTMKMIFSVNDSPFSGTEGEYCTSRNIKERLEKELMNDVALEMEAGKSAEKFVISGRGELHLAILIEKMRREGYEFQVSKPEVIFKEENGQLSEPAEDVWIEAAEQYSGIVIEKMNRRKGEMKNMNVENGVAYFHFFLPTRGLIGFRNEFMIETKGTGIINTLFAGYFPKFGDLPEPLRGSLIVSETGTTTAYSLLNSQERGKMFVGPGIKVYEGQVVGQNAKAGDMVVNVCKPKQLTNFRAKTDAVTNDLIPPQTLSIEQALEYIADDELVEITPKSIRMRKRILKNNMRK